MARILSRLGLVLLLPAAGLLGCADNTETVAERIVGEDAADVGADLAARLTDGDPQERSLADALGAALQSARDHMSGAVSPDHAPLFVTELPRSAELLLVDAGERWPEVLLAGMICAYGGERSFWAGSFSDDEARDRVDAFRLRERPAGRLDHELLEVVAERSLWFDVRVRAVIALCRPESLGIRDDLVAIALDRTQSRKVREAILVRLHRFEAPAPESLEPALLDPGGRFATYAALVLARGGRPVAPGEILTWLRSLAAAERHVQHELKLMTPDAVAGLCPDDPFVVAAAEQARAALAQTFWTPDMPKHPEQVAFQALLAAVESHLAAHPEVMDTPHERLVAEVHERAQSMHDAAPSELRIYLDMPDGDIDVLVAHARLREPYYGPDVWTVEYAERLVVAARRRLGTRVRDPAALADVIRSFLTAPGGPIAHIGVVGVADGCQEAMAMASGDDASTAAVALYVADAIGVPARPRETPTGFVVEIGAHPNLHQLNLCAWTRMRTAARHHEAAAEWLTLPDGTAPAPSAAALASPRRALLARLLVANARAANGDAKWQRGGDPARAARHAERAVRLDPGYVAARLCLARFSATSAETPAARDAAAAHLAAARALRALTPAERIDEALALHALGAKAEARRVLTELADLEPALPWASFLAVARNAIGLPAQAR